MDHRRQKTKRAFQQALFDLLATKPIEQITVVELSRRAGVSRRTFYVHYQTITDILTDYRQELYWQVRQALTNQHQPARELLSVFDQILQQNLTGFRYLCLNNFHQELVKKFEQLLCNAISDSLPTPPDGSQEVILHFLSSGLIQTYVYWFAHPKALTYTELMQINRRLVAANWPLLIKSDHH